MIDSSFVASIVGVAQDAAKAEPRVVVIDGVSYVDRDLKDLRKAEPQQTAVELSTLRGLSDYVKHAISIGEVSTDCVIHVDTPDLVAVLGKSYGRFKQRDSFATAEYVSPFEGSHTNGFGFGKYVDLETFNIALQSLFAPGGDREKLLAVVGNITDESVKAVADDGVTQQVIVRQGVQRRAEVDAPNPVTLKPYRSFAEIDQPEVPFVLRMSPGDTARGTVTRAALFEADGGKWRLEAIGRIADYLRQQDTGLSVLS